MTSPLDLAYTEPYFPSNIDSTMMSAFFSCPQKFFLEFILRRAPIGRSIHLHAGGCVASAMESIRKDYYGLGFSLDECFERAFRLYVQQWGDFDAPEKEYKDFVNCWAVVEAYFREYPPDTDFFQPLMKEDGMPAVEFRFAIPTEVNHPITGEPILMSGRLDLLAHPQGGTSVYAVDEKTAKSMGSSWQYQWDMRGQFFGYVIAAQQYGYDCNAALVRGMAIQQTQFQFQEKPLFYSNEQLAHFWDQFNRKLRRMVQMWEHMQELQGNRRLMHNEWDYSYGDACGSYGGCHMKDCCVHPEPWHILEGFETRVWNPMAKDPSAESEDRTRGMMTQSLQEMMGTKL